MIQLIGIGGILNNSADRLKKIYVVELEAIGPVQTWRRKCILRIKTDYYALKQM